MKKVFAIGVVNTKRFLRERSNLFFVFIFPLLIVLLLGSAFGGGFGATLGVYVAGDGPLTSDLLTSLGEKNFQVISRHVAAIWTVDDPATVAATHPENEKCQVLLALNHLRIGWHYDWLSESAKAVGGSFQRW